MGKVVLLTAVILLLVTSGLVVAGSGYEIAWFSVNGGGGHSGGGIYAVSGTIGQADVGQSNGESYSLQAGFWQTQLTARYSIYLPVVTKAG